MPKTILVVGSSGSGKTTLIERIIPVLTEQGFRVASVKHAHHGFQVDKKGSDSDRHATAGSTPVLLVSEDKAVAIWHRSAPQTRELIDLLMADADIVIAEGHGSLSGPKILVHRSEVEPRPLTDPENVFAAVTDEPIGFEFEFSPDDIDEIVAKIVEVVSRDA